MGLETANKTIGQGGDYSDWASFFAAIDPTPTGRIKGTQISDITESGTIRFTSPTVFHSQTTISDVYYDSSFEIDGSGYTTTLTLNNEDGFFISGYCNGGLSKIIVRNMNIQAATGNSGSGYNLLSLTSTGYENICSNNRINANGTKYNGIYFGYIANWYQTGAYKWGCSVDDNYISGGLRDSEVAGIKTYFGGDYDAQLLGSGNFIDGFYYGILNTASSNNVHINATITNSGALPPFVYTIPTYLQPANNYNTRQFCFIESRNGSQMNFLPSGNGRQMTFKE